MALPPGTRIKNVPLPATISSRSIRPRGAWEVQRDSVDLDIAKVRWFSCISPGVQTESQDNKTTALPPKEGVFYLEPPFPRWTRFFPLEIS